MRLGHPTRAVVMVLGDFGRSPRMQYHTLALAESGIDVDVVAYTGAPPMSALRAHRRVRFHFLAPPRQRQRSALPKTLVAALMVMRMLKHGWRGYARSPIAD